MAGPAEQLWRIRFPKRPLFGSVNEALDGAAAVLSGTGWASDLEHEARRRALEFGKHSVAVLDHWVNYSARFVRDDHQVLPDSIWVTDEYARAMAESFFPQTEVMLLPNLYLEEQIRRVRAGGYDPTDVLYVAEPARNEWGRGVPGEFQALEYFLAHRDRAGIYPEVAIRLRPHPSDPPKKYDPWLEHCGGQVSLDTTLDLADAIGRAEWVAGCQSFALVVALGAGRKTVSVLPPWAPPCVLPHPGLLHLGRIGTDR